MRLLAVDPGERYVGYAYFVDRQVLYCDVAGPIEAVQHLWPKIESEQVDVVVVEQWRNYDAKVTWSECRTVEVIGALEHMCLRHEVRLVRQPSMILRPGAARMRAHGVKLPSLDHIPAKDRNHAESAVIHGHWYLFQHRLTGAQTAG